MQRSRRFSWPGLAIFLLTVSLFPAQASTPGLRARDTSQVERTCAASNVVASGSWGTCMGGGGCCFGREESPCDPRWF
jgi:hypothetical protein